MSFSLDFGLPGSGEIKLCWFVYAFFVGFCSLVLGSGCQNASCARRGREGLLAILDAGLFSSRRLMLVDNQEITVLVCEVLELKIVNLDLLVIVFV